MKETTSFCVAMGLVILAAGLTGCQTTDVMLWKPTYDPATYGTEALKQTVNDTTRPVRDAVAAAEELAHRALNEKDGGDMFALLRAARNHKIRVALLETMKIQKMAYLRDDLMVLQPQLNHPDSAAAGAAAISSFMESDADLFEFMKMLLMESSHGNVRARAARFLTSFKEECEPTLIEALKKETSASTALIMCQALHDFGSAKALAVLSDIANTVTRTFTADKYLDEKASAETVRAAAVAAVETITRRTGR